MYANIIIDISHEKLDKTFQYHIPDTLLTDITVGVQVQVPFGNSKRTGYVIELTETPEYEVSKIKDIVGIVGGSVAIEGQLIALAAWMRRNYGATMNQALKTVLPVKKKENEKVHRTLVLKLPMIEAKNQLAEYERKKHKARARLLEALIENEKLPYEVVTGKLGITAAVITALKEQGVITIETQSYYRNPVGDYKTKPPHVLNEAQRQVADRIHESFLQKTNEHFLLKGVTGSGKTEVYMELIARAIDCGKQAIVLIPEIALTFQTLMRFYARFGNRVSIMHSRLSVGERYDQFERAKHGEIDVMIGPRSALFTPFSNLGYIIIDEEHESSYKSETLPRYHARETALERARMCGATVVLGSATPSLESYYRAEQGELTLLRLDNRVEEKELPVCHVVDLREELRRGNRSIISDKLKTLMEERLKKGQQMMLFINRRGLSGFVSCRSCGEAIQCPHCAVSLSLHKNGKLKCHYCGYETPMVKVCPSCGSKYIGGFKAGTQKIEEIVTTMFPGVRVLRMDYDTTRTKDSYEQILSAFANQEADVLIGTQMIVKGHDFPNVTLVGILAADMSLYISDYRSGERTFQLLTQAAGRAGRGKLPGEVVIQTYQPEHYSIQTAKGQDYEAFYEQEIAYRSMLGYPPVGNLMVVLLTSTKETVLEQFATMLADQVKQIMPKLSVIGPTDAAVARINDVYRKVFYIKSSDYQKLVGAKDAIEEMVGDMVEYKDCSMQFDFNPMNLM